MTNTVNYAMWNMLSLPYLFICVRERTADGILAIDHNPRYQDVIVRYGSRELDCAFISYDVLYIDII